MKSYKSPEGGLPFDGAGLLSLANQCLDASRDADSSLLEMAGLALRRIAHIKLQSESPKMFNRLLACLDEAEKQLGEGGITYRELDEAAMRFQYFAERLRKTELGA
jgi:hypothetical protein